MFAVRCPASMLWHPSVHHSMLLLRALQQPHTLQIDPFTATHLRFHVPLLSECCMDLSVHYQSNVTPLKKVEGLVRDQDVALYRPEDVLHMLRCPPHAWRWPVLSDEVQLAATRSLAEYLEASTVSAHIMSAVDALLVALNTGDMETIRQTHACVIELVERLELSMADIDVFPGSNEDTATSLSTWPLFSILQFLVEDGGLLVSAFPRTNKAYTRLKSTNKAVVQHRRLVQRTVDEQLNAPNTPPSSSESRAEKPLEINYPVKEFLRDVQRHLAAYNRSVEEGTTDGVTGDKGPLHSRVSGGRLGIQAVPARLPWTLQGKQLPRQ